MAFDMTRCAIPSFWCGTKTMPRGIKDNKRYLREGTSHECMKVGFGAGMATEKSKHLEADSVGNIKYIDGSILENMANEGIITQQDLLDDVSQMTPMNKELRIKYLTRKKSGYNKKAYNTILVWLRKKRIGNLPQCDLIN